MAISFEWKGHDGNDWNFVISPTNVIGFYGPGGYGSPIQVGQYNDSMHIRTSLSDDTAACAPAHLTNLKYIADTEVSINGGSPVALTSVVDTNCIMIHVQSDTEIKIIGSRLYAYDGNNVDNPQQNVVFKAFKLGDSQWSQPHGRSNALDCGTSDTATDHYFYIGMSLSPTSTGAATTFVVRFEIDVS